jgi:hypothetical protein
MTDHYHYGPASIVDIRRRRIDMTPPRDPMRDALDACHTRIAEQTVEIDRWQVATLCAVLVVVVEFAMLIW